MCCTGNGSTLSMYMYMCMCASNSHLLAIETEWILYRQVQGALIGISKAYTCTCMYDVFLVVNFSGTRCFN